ncbi:MAG: entericidin A/B family lipoprotein [Phycisphaeraceae bacterium]|nr:entericidin A/B family lipoprotein [Phycisphaeraceae bacterium]
MRCNAIDSRAPRFAIVLVLGLLALATFGLASCNTTQGVGEDLQAAGEAIDEAAEDAN